jgi:hypothetical protein
MMNKDIKTEIRDILTMANELEKVDPQKLSECKGILQGVLLFAKKEINKKIV